MTNIKYVRSAERRVDKFNASSDFSVIANKPKGRPKKEIATTDTRTSRELFDNSKCLFCQEQNVDDESKLHSVETENMGIQFLEIGKSTKK